MSLLPLSAIADPIQATREIVLSPGHMVTPYRIERASNGDFIVAGSVGVSDYRAWATRVSSVGAVVWEYLDGSAEGWTDQSVLGQRFFDIVDLPNQEAILCGIRKHERRPIAFLIKLNATGGTSWERPLQPSQGNVPVGIRCTRWGDGVAVTGTFTSSPRAIGWLAKFTQQGELVWEKFGDDYGNGDVIPAANGGLFILTSLGHQGIPSIVSLNDKGEVLGRQLLPAEASDEVLVRTPSPSVTVRVAYMMATRNTMVAEYSSGLVKPPDVKSIKDAGIKQAVELADGSVAIFGSQQQNGATASIARLHRNGSGDTHLLSPPHRSPWFFDAVPSGTPNEFAATLNYDLTAKLLWISLK